MGHAVPEEWTIFEVGGEADEGSYDAEEDKLGICSGLKTACAFRNRKYALGQLCVHACAFQG